MKRAAAKANKHICVFLSSSDEVDPIFSELAREMGREIGKRRYGLVYGGSNAGLMGELARKAHAAGAAVVAIMPKLLHKKAPALDLPHDLVITEDMRARKTVMEMRSDIFVALPGGFGTLEELMEILTLKQLGYHNKPVIILNANKFYDALIGFFEQLFKMKFAKQKTRGLYQVCESVEAAFRYIDGL